LRHYGGCRIVDHELRRRRRAADLRIKRRQLEPNGTDQITGDLIVGERLPREGILDHDLRVRGLHS
jgi:hypothetical protein